MPLARYGAAIGSFVSFERDSPDQFGRWYHGHLTIATPAGQYESALDVDTPSGVGISYRVSRNLPQTDLGPVATMPDGFHALASTPTSGALDYLRSPMFQDSVVRRRLPQPTPGLRPVPPATPAGEGRPPWWDDSPPERLLRLLGSAARLVPRRLLRFRPWVRSTGDNALSALEAELPNATRIYIFGEHFQHGDRGVHDVHMNQGDPAGSQWWASNGIWQDGAVVVQRSDGTLFAWQVKFNSQSMQTDANGHPA
jgi:Uncharacterized conserved protein (DUF2278)